VVDCSSEGDEGDRDGGAGIEIPSHSVGEGHCQRFELSSADGTGELDLLSGVLQGLDEVLRKILWLRMLAMKSECWGLGLGRRDDVGKGDGVGGVGAATGAEGKDEEAELETGGG
jgi:hypothetical protein